MRAAEVKQAPYKRHILLAILTIFLLFLGTSQAFADGNIGGDMGAPGGGDTGGGDTGKVPPPPGGNTGGGSGVRGYVTSYSSNTSGSACAATKNNGELKGVNFVIGYPKATMTAEEAVSRYEEHMKIGSPIRVITAQVNCIYTAQYVKKSVTCVTSLNAGLAMTTPRSKHLGNTPYTSPFKSSQRLADCETGDREVSIKKTVEDFGRYKFTGNATVQDCTYRKYTSADGLTGKWKSDEIEKCGSPRPKPPVIKKWQLDCDGFHTSWFGSPGWDADDCKTTSKKTGSWTCTIPSKNKINGEKTNKATVFRDGEDNPLVFGKSKPKGNSIVRINKTKTQVLRGKAGTPWEKGRASNANTFGLRVGNHNILSTESKSSWKGSNDPNVSAYGLMESTKGKPTSLKAKYGFDLTVKSVKVRIKSVNVKTGVPVIQRTVINKDTTGTCFSNPLKLTFVRGVVSQ